MNDPSDAEMRQSYGQHIYAAAVRAGLDDDTAHRVAARIVADHTRVTIEADGTRRAVITADRLSPAQAVAQLAADELTAAKRAAELAAKRAAKPDLASLTAVEYRELRATNPEAIGLSGYRVGRP